jgi:hypothetical protein
MANGWKAMAVVIMMVMKMAKMSENVNILVMKKGQ